MPHEKKTSAKQVVLYDKKHKLPKGTVAKITKCDICYNGITCPCPTMTGCKDYLDMRIMQVSYTNEYPVSFHKGNR